MTVIAASVAEGRMAADCWCLDGDEHYPMRKVFRVNGRLVGFAGDVSVIRAALIWMRKGCDPDSMPDGDVVALLLSNRGLETWTPAEGFLPAPPQFAIGSGSACARVALGLGVGVRRAVLETNKVHAECGGGVSVYTLAGRAA